MIHSLLFSSLVPSLVSLVSGLSLWPLASLCSALKPNPFMLCHAGNMLVRGGLLETLRLVVVYPLDLAATVLACNLSISTRLLLYGLPIRRQILPRGLRSHCAR